MNSKATLKILALLLLMCVQLNAQLSTKEVPVGFKHNFESIPTIITPKIYFILN